MVPGSVRACALGDRQPARGWHDTAVRWKDLGAEGCVRGAPGDGPDLMRWLTSATMLATVAACATNHTGAAISYRAQCPANMVAAQPFELAKVKELAGEFRLIMRNAENPVNTLMTARLSLAVNDSASRYVPRRLGYAPGERPLVGKATNESGPGLPFSMVQEQDALFLDSALFMGQIDGMHGFGYRMVVQRMGHGGFAGVWEYFDGFEIIVDSATGRELKFGGPFCALRTPIE